jgi:glycosyltransferase involved in cell wall biosynthesis
MNQGPHLRRPRVAVVSPMLVHYRVPFHERLRRALSERGIDYELFYGTGPTTEPERGDQADIDWATPFRARAIAGTKGKLVWQPVLRATRRADLVVVMQMVQFGNAYVLMARQLFRVQRMAFWGHGRNFQADDASRAPEAVKRWMSRRVHWWFAYNDLAAEIVARLGFPSERITNVQNAIDTAALVEARQRLSAAAIEDIRERHGIDGSRRGQVAINVGGLYKNRRLDILIAAAEHIRKYVPDFELIVVGAGSEQKMIEEAAQRHPWLHYLGPRFGEEKVALFALSKVQLIPGAVGLGVLDSFALETPLVTLADSSHGPEIDYLKSGVNGLMVDPGDDPVVSFADVVIRLMRDEAIRQELVAGCQSAGRLYTIDEMVGRFADGVEAALAAPDLRTTKRRLGD